MTARDYASKRKNNAELMELFEDEVVETGVQETFDEDGLTSTQRNKMKKKAMRDAEQKSLLAAMSATSLGGEEAEEAIQGEGSTSNLGPHGLPPLPKPAPTPYWPELTTAVADAATLVPRRELKVEKLRSVGEENEDGSPPQSCTADDASPVLVDPSLWHLGLLNRLELHVSCMTTLSPFVGHLSALQTLIVSGCDLTSLPLTLACLGDLKFLDLSRNRLSDLPSSLGTLKKIEVLDVSRNSLSSLGPVSQLTSLTTLLADANELTELSLNFPGLVRLETLSVSSNKLTSLPEDIGAPQLFAVLNVADNLLTELPVGLSNLKEKKIREVSCCECTMHKTTSVYSVVRAFKRSKACLRIITPPHIFFHQHTKIHPFAA